MGKKTLIYLLLSIALFLNPGLKAQDCEWLEVGGGAGNQFLLDITLDDSNNVISCGEFYTNFTHFGKNLTVPTPNTSGNSIIVKHDNNGTFKWVVQTSVSTNGNFCQFSSVKTDNQNNIYVLAFFRGTVNFGNGISISTQFSNTSGLALVKYNTNGIAQWVRDIAPTNNSSTYNLFGKVTVGANNTVFVGFRFLNSVRFGGTSQTLTSNGGLDIGVVKYSSSGAYQSSARFGSTSPDQFSEIDCDAFDNVYISGYSYGSFSFGSQTLSDTGIVILKTDSALSPIVARKIDINFQGSGGANVPMSVEPNGKFVISCSFSDTVDFGGVTLTDTISQGNRNLFIAHYTNNLNAIWVKKENKFSSITSTFTSGLAYKNGFIYLGGSFANGNTSFGNNTLTYVPFGNNLFITKIDTLGNFLWAFSSKNSGTSSVTADNAGNTYACGTFSDSITIFNKKSITNQVNDFFLAKITDYSITRGNVNPGPYCAGDSFKIPYTKTGRYDTGNVFIAQLSDSAGNFDGSERELGRITDTAAGEIKGVLPLFDVATTNKYRIRIISTKPVVQSFFRRDTLRLLIYSKDTANAGPDRLVCRGEPIRLGTTGGSKWQWSPATFMPNKADTNNRQPRIVPDSALEYRIIISDSSGCGLTDTDYVKINLRPDLDIQVAGPSSICRGQTVTLRAQPSGGDGSFWYQWITVGKAGVPIAADSLVVSPDTTTTYRLVLGDSCTAKNDTVFFTLQVDSVLNVFVINDTTLCKGTKDFPLRAWGSGCDSSNYMFWWVDMADTTTLLGNGSQLLISPQTTTNYRVILQDTATLLSDTAFVKVSVDNFYIATLTKDSTICKGQSLLLEAGAISCDTSQLSFIWNNGLDTLKSHTVTPNITTTYTVIVTNKFNGLKDTASVTVTVRPPLKVTVNADTTICIGESAELRAIATGGDSTNYSFTWKEIGTATIVNSPKATVTPIKTTTYRIILTDGCTILSDSAEIKISVRDSLKITVNADTTICVGEKVALRATVAGGDSTSRTILWSVAGGASIASNPFTIVNPIQTTTYRALLADGCTKINDSAEIIITVRQPLNVSVNGLTNACVDDTVTLTAQATGGDSTNYSYFWTLPDGSNLVTPIINVTPTITSQYKIKIGDNCSNPAFDSTTHTINIPAPISISTNKDTVICDGWSVPLSAIITGGVPANYKLLWENVNSSFSDTNAAVIVKPAATTQYYISVSDNCSLPQKDTVSITVLPSPKADFSLQNNIGCEPLLVITQDLSQNHDTLFNVWKTNTTIREGKQPTLVYPQAGTYNVALVVKNSLGCADSSSKTAAVVVHPLPVASFTVSPAIKQIEEEITYTNTSVGAISYTWLLANNDSIKTQDKLPITKIYNDTGNFAIQLIAKTNNDCVDTATTYISLVDLFTVVVPNAFSPNGDLLNDIFGPVNTGTLAYKMTLFNRWGEVIYYCECAEGCPTPCTWDGNYKGTPLQEGTYFYILNLEAQNRIKRNIMGSVVLVR